jgi:hypothetical protein
MIRLLLTFLVIALTGCGTYKIVPIGTLEKVSDSQELLTVLQVNEFPQGNHCFEPMMYVLTLGIIPTHCVDTYNVTSGEQEIGQVKVTSMQGWVALLIAPLPTWQFGFPEGVDARVSQMLEASE